MNGLSADDYQKTILALAGVSIPIKQLPPSNQENRNHKTNLKIIAFSPLTSTLIWEKNQLDLPTQLLIDIPISKKEIKNLSLIHI